MHGEFGTDNGDYDIYKPTKHDYFINNNIKIIDIDSQIATNLFIDENGNGYMCGFGGCGMFMINMIMYILL